MQNKKSVYFIICVKVAVGCALYAVGFSFFLYPNSIMVGGVSGIAMIINYLTELPVGVMTVILNVPLFIFAWKKLGLKFILASLAGMLLSSVLVDAFSAMDIIITSEPLLACIYGGVVKGFGLGLIYSAGATTGGMDIAAKLIRRWKPYINLGTILLALDIIVILIFAVIFGRYDSAMYAVIAMFIVSKVVDLVLYGANISKVCYVITDYSSEITTAISEQLQRGVTYLRGEGAYSRIEKNVILCVIKQQQIVELRNIVREIDEHAFIIISDSREVLGKGFGSIMSNE